jgi:predicted secreted hydrolase
MTTVYRTSITKFPHTDDMPEFWHVELMTHTEDGLQVEFKGEFFKEQDANAMAAAWRHKETRPIVWLCASLTRAEWHDN